VRIGGRLQTVAAGGLAAVLAAALVAAVLSLPTEPRGLAGAVADRMAETEVGNPVTAVLLAFRAYDTALEMGVLLLAAFGVFALRRRHALGEIPPLPPTGLVLRWMVRLVVPLLILAGGYLLWRGTHAPGGAFQAGALWGAAAVMLRLAGDAGLARVRGWSLRVGLSVGVAAFVLAAMLPGTPPLAYPAGWSIAIIIAIEAGVTASVAASLGAFFTAAQPPSSA
jgi:multisubunit Na+/H+ antiporter MnhB subunit